MDLENHNVAVNGWVWSSCKQVIMGISLKLLLDRQTPVSVNIMHPHDVQKYGIENNF